MNKTFLLIALLALAAGCAQQMQLGKFGSAHQHADFKVYINNVPFNFSQEKYMVPLGPNGSDDTDCLNGTRLAHLHDMDGNVVHVHATGVTWGYFFSTLNMTWAGSCFTLDNGNSYCDNAASKWRFFINGTEVQNLMGAEIQDQSRVLFTYGATEAQISAQMASVTYGAQNESTGSYCGTVIAAKASNSSAPALS